MEANNIIVSCWERERKQKQFLYRRKKNRWMSTEVPVFFFFFSFLFFLVGKNKLLCLVMFDSLRCVGNIYHAVSLLFILISSLEPLMAAIILKDFFHSIFKRIHLENLLLSSWFLVFFFFFFFFLRLTCVSKWNHQKLNNSQRVFFFLFWRIFCVFYCVALVSKGSSVPSPERC